jgi:hypothetical protein
VPKIVKAELRQAELSTHPVERSADRVTAHRLTGAAYEHPLVAGPRWHVLGEDRQNMRRDRDRALAGVGRGIGIERLGCLKQLDTIAP